MENTEIVLSNRVALLRGLAIPACGLDHVPGHATVTAVVQHTQGELCRGIAALSLGLPLAYRLGTMTGVEARQGQLIRADRVGFRAHIMARPAHRKNGNR